MTITTARPRLGVAPMNDGGLIGEWRRCCTSVLYSCVGRAQNGARDWSSSFTVCHGLSRRCPRLLRYGERSAETLLRT
jgi:hypothetical protein